MDEMKWEKLAEIYGRLEAEGVKSYLEAEGIQVELIQEAIDQLRYLRARAGLCAQGAA